MEYSYRINRAISKIADEQHTLKATLYRLRSSKIFQRKLFGLSRISFLTKVHKSLSKKVLLSYCDFLMREPDVLNDLASIKAGNMDSFEDEIGNLLEGNVRGSVIWKIKQKINLLRLASYLEGLPEEIVSSILGTSGNFRKFLESRALFDLDISLLRINFDGGIPLTKRYILAVITHTLNVL